MNTIAVAIPCLNEAGNIELVINQLRSAGLDQFVLGIDPKTTDHTKKLAENLGVITTPGTKTGYDGTISAAATKAIAAFPHAKYLLFSDCGGKFNYDILPKFMTEINTGAKLVLGVRIHQRQHMLWHQKLGTSAILLPIRLLFKQNIQDISPFRLIDLQVLKQLDMQSKNFSWPSQMLVKCLSLKIPIAQVPVTSNKRIGTSKVSGNLKNSILAGVEMVSSLKYYGFSSK